MIPKIAKKKDQDLFAKLLPEINCFSFLGYFFCVFTFFKCIFCVLYNRIMFIIFCYSFSHLMIDSRLMNLSLFCKINT